MLMILEHLISFKFISKKANKIYRMFFKIKCENIRKNNISMPQKQINILAGYQFSFLIVTFYRIVPKFLCF